MQITAYGTIEASELGVSSISDGLALVVEGATLRLVYCDDGANQVYSSVLGTTTTAPGSGMLAEGMPADGSAAWSSVQPGEGMSLLVGAGQSRLFVFSDQGAALTTALIGANGAPGATTTVASSEGALVGVTNMATLSTTGLDLAALSTYASPGIEIFSVASDGYLTLTDAIPDSEKAHLGDISDVELIQIGGTTYLLTLSALESGLTCFVVDETGQAELHDSFGMHDGLDASGCAAMQVLNVAGTDYVLVASTTSSSLSVVRINDQGCFFAVDTIVDDKSTRFAHVEAFDTFVWSGRTFVVAAGTDAGISILEVMPDGELEVITSVALETGEGLGAVTSIETAVDGNSAYVYLVDAGSDQVLQFSVALANVGGTIYASAGTANGTSKDDLILGGSEAETLKGNSGADRIYDGAGADTLTGGSGADVFVLSADTSTDRISDYELHTDKLDLTDWGRIYTADVLTITSTSTGCTISYGSHVLTVTSSTGTSLTEASFTDDDFIFV